MVTALPLSLWDGDNLSLWDGDNPFPVPLGWGHFPLSHGAGDNPAPVPVGWGQFPFPTGMVTTLPLSLWHLCHPVPCPGRATSPSPGPPRSFPSFPHRIPGSAHPGLSLLSPHPHLDPSQPPPATSSSTLVTKAGDIWGQKPPPNPPCVFPGQNTGMKAVPGVPDLWERVRRSFGARRQNSLMSPISGGLAGAVTSARTRRRFHPPRQRRKSRQGAGKMFQRVGKRGIFGFFPSFPPLIPHRRHWGCHSGAQEMSPRVCSPWFGAGGGKGSGGALLVGKDSPNPTNPTKPMPSPLPCVLCWV